MSRGVILARRRTVETRLGPFEAVSMLRGVFGTVPLRPLLPVEWRRYRLGRCRLGDDACGRVWAWPKRAASLSEMGCPGCAGRLGRTSWNVKRTVWLVPASFVLDIVASSLPWPAEFRELVQEGTDLDGIRASCASTLAALLSVGRSLSDEETEALFGCLVGLDCVDEVRTRIPAELVTKRLVDQDQDRRG